MSHEVFVAEVRKSLAKAEALYGVDLSIVEIACNKKGWKVAADAGMWMQFGRITRLRLRFHPLAIRKHWDAMVNEVIPHEVAHLVCYANENLGRNHNRGWQAVCRALGGTGQRCHSFNLMKDENGNVLHKKRPTYKYLYRFDNASGTIELGVTRHNRLQKGRTGGYAIIEDGIRKKIRRTGFIRRTV